MIDLTKPIRRKGDDKPLRISGPVALYDVTDGFRAERCSFAELERNYENIPEPRNPREWRASICATGAICSHIGDELRVIEWPVGAPIPSWPEGYGGQQIN